MIQELKRLTSIVDQGSITKASKKLFLTQPALSLSIKRLEDEIGIKLFKHIGKRLVLTREGKSVYQIGTQILKLWTKIKDNKNINLEEAKYSIGIFDNAALKLSKFFQKSFSKNIFKFEITIDRSSTLIKAMRNGLFDICICIVAVDFALEKEVIVVKEFVEKLIPVSRKLWKKEMKNIPFIMYNNDSATRKYTDEVFIKHNIKPNIIVESTSPAFMKNLAMGGFGVALLPENFVETEIKQKKLFVQKFPFQFKRKVGLFLSKDSNLKKEDRLVQEIIKNLQ
ncbi:MAG: LysR family transcriptional regulator [Candidatus Levybacteria bacterium]|nr:LysR family transcriptional regulator [Candidatus Levybacteria bacterium]